MTVPARYIFLVCAFLFALALAPRAAFADCAGCQRPRPSCHSNCQPAPPPVCHNCAPPTIVVPPPSVTPPNIVVGQVGAQAQANAMSIAISQARSGDTVIRMGGGGFGGVSVDAGVTAAALSVSESMVESAAIDRTLVLQAICLDVNGTPHPASQTFGERDVRDAYAGEIFRCMAGTRMRYTMDGRSYDCATGEALWYEGGAVSCRTQIARRPCNERSLLRRFGPGEKLVLIRETSTRQTNTDFSASMTMDGGVGQGVW